MDAFGIEIMNVLKDDLDSFFFNVICELSGVEFFCVVHPEIDVVCEESGEFFHDTSECDEIVVA